MRMHCQRTAFQLIKFDATIALMRVSTRLTNTFRETKTPRQSNWLQGYLAHKKHPPPQDHHRFLGIGLLQGSTGGGVLMSEVPLYPPRTSIFHTRGAFLEPKSLPLCLSEQQASVWNQAFLQSKRLSLQTKSFPETPLWILSILKVRHHRSLSF